MRKSTTEGGGVVFNIFNTFCLSSGTRDRFTLYICEVRETDRIFQASVASIGLCKYAYGK
jgi:hypothetical protein